jgi:hypothetical protein
MNMGRLKLNETYTCNNCIHLEETDCESCVGCRAMDKDTIKPRGWQGASKVIPLTFDATAFLRAMKGQPVTRIGVDKVLKSMVNNLELQRMPYFCMTRIHLHLNNILAAYVDDGHKSLVVMLYTDDIGHCIGKYP